MRRFAAFSIVAVLCTTLVPSAVATTTPSVIPSHRVGVPDPWTVGAVNCADQTQGADLSAPHPYGPGTPPMGVGSLQLPAPTGFAAAVGTTLLPNTDLSALSALDAWFYVPSMGGATPSFLLFASDGTDDYTLRATASGSGSWEHLDAMTATLSWWSADSSTGVAGPTGSESLASFVGTHSNVVLTDVAVVGTCGPGTFYVDALTLGIGSNVTTIDFEPPIRTALTNLAHPSRVLTGQSVALAARLDCTGCAPPGAMPGQTVMLYARPAGSSVAYRPLLFTTTDGSAVAHFSVAPVSSTQYQVRFPDNGGDVAPATSASFTIVTRQRVAVTSRPKTVRYRRIAVVKGRIRPTRSGVTVRLVRLVSGRRVIVASVRTVAGGYYTLKARMKVRGRATYVVTALPYPGEGLGQSPSFRIATK